MGDTSYDVDCSMNRLVSHKRTSNFSTSPQSSGLPSQSQSRFRGQTLHHHHTIGAQPLLELNRPLHQVMGEAVATIDESSPSFLSFEGVILEPYDILGVSLNFDVRASFQLIFLLVHHGHPLPRFVESTYICRLFRQPYILSRA